MYKLFLLLAYLLCSFTAFSQDDYRSYHQLIAKRQASSSMDSSIVYLKQAMKAAAPFPEDVASLSNVYYNTRNKKKSEKYILQAITLGRQVEADPGFGEMPFRIEYKMDYIKNDTISSYGRFLDSLHRLKPGAFHKARTAYMEGIDPIDDAIFESLLQNENYFQSLRFLFYDQKVKDSTAFTYVAKYGPAPNSYYMLELLRKDIFPRRRKCARFNSQTITMLLNHGIAGFLNKADALEFVTLLWKIVPQGELTPYEYACAYDQYVACFIDPQKSYFGTRMFLTPGNTLGLMDLIDPLNVNQIRKEHWLESLDSFIESAGLTPPSNYGK